MSIRLTRGGSRRQLEIRASWPWAADIVTAWNQISLGDSALTR
jgi:hypothetical protein